ncbi:MAG: hypothetical protein KDC34_14655 [Saprospiraceae bacterium]|nr:hypothetical protein [Saprospiraceae bacterium]
MYRFLLFIAVTLFSLSSCQKDPILKELPQCVQDLVKDIKKAPITDPPTSLYSYTFEGATVYYISGPCCDIFSTLYNEDCEIICHPDGGFTGGGDGLCPDFLSKATDEKLLWMDGAE